MTLKAGVQDSKSTCMITEACHPPWLWAWMCRRKGRVQGAFSIVDSAIILPAKDKYELLHSLFNSTAEHKTNQVVMDN
jgi:hypothetical protein